MNKYIKWFLTAAWYLLIIYGVMQLIAIIIMGFLIPEVGKTLIVIFISVGLGYGLGYLRGREVGLR